MDSLIFSVIRWGEGEAKHRQLKKLRQSWGWFYFLCGITPLQSITGLKIKNCNLQ